MARKLGYLLVPDDTLVTVETALKLPPEQVVLMCTGSQGEPSSIIGRLSAGTNRQFDLLPTDTVVLSSHPIPGNEETISKTINRMLRMGANVIYDSIAPVHVSGHASQEEQKLMLNLVRPKYFMPIHGELRQVQAARLAGRANGHAQREHRGRGKRPGGGTGRRQTDRWRTHSRRVRLRGRRGDWRC